jgi:heme-degrading monooxygenase HmoA
MPRIDQDAGYATFINTFHCRPEHQDEVVGINVEIVDRVARQHPGFISATVHRSVDGTRVINYLQWQTAEDLAHMQASTEFRTIAARFAGLIQFDPHQCEIAHVGETDVIPG